jgi:predicted dehydrogenase
MTPIRVGLVGLSADDTQGPTVGNWGVLAHMKPLLASPHYELVAICNSSVESSQKSIDFHKLPKTVKAYGSVEDLASDPDIDLIAISVNIAKHYQLVKPALLKKKNVLVEWPLAASIDESRELAQLAEQQGVQTILGLQLRSDPLVVKTKELIDGGSIGSVTSSVVFGCSSVIPSDIWIAEASYYLDMKTGGNEFYIYFGHCKPTPKRYTRYMLIFKVLDAFTSVLGDFKTTQSILKTQHPTVATVSCKTGKQIEAAVPKTAPDHIFVQGELLSGALASISFRKAKKPVDALGLRWLITGTEGEIEITFPEDHFQFGHAGRAIRFRSGKNEEVKVIKWDNEEEPAYVRSVPYPGTNTARLYEAFVKDNGQLADFGTALKNHELLHKIAKDAKFI